MQEHVLATHLCKVESLSKQLNNAAVPRNIYMLHAGAEPHTWWHVEGTSGFSFVKGVNA
jgi:hypothetical protein